MSEYGIIYFYPYILYNKIGHCDGEHIYRCSDLLKKKKENYLIRLCLFYKL